MNPLRFGHTDGNFLLQAIFPRRWLLACSLVVILPGLFLFGLATGARGESITVYDTQVQGYINPLAFGQNVFFAGNYLWDHEADGITQRLVKGGIYDNNGNVDNKIKTGIERLAPAILRFPGGTAADLYLWEDGLGGGEGCRLISVDKAHGAAGECDLPGPGHRSGSYF